MSRLTDPVDYCWMNCYKGDESVLQENCKLYPCFEKRMWDKLNHYEDLEEKGNAMSSIDLQDDNFGAVLNCAIRYCIGRRTYMPDLVTSYIRPLLPYLSRKTVQVMWDDIRSASSYGDPCDEVTWMNFLQDLVAELDRRDDEKDVLK